MEMRKDGRIILTKHCTMYLNSVERCGTKVSRMILHCGEYRLQLSFKITIHVLPKKIPKMSRLRTSDLLNDYKDRKATPAEIYAPATRYQEYCDTGRSPPPQQVKRTGHQPTNAEQPQQAL